MALITEFTNRLGVVMDYDEYMTLLNLGFTEKEIDYMPRDIFEENKDLTATLVAQNQKYYKTIYPAYGNGYTVEVTENEFLNHGDSNILGSVTTYYHTVVSSISQNGNLYRYKSTMYWESIPPIKSYDVIAIGFSGLIHINTTATFYQVYTDSTNNDIVSMAYYVKDYSGVGGSTTYKVPSSFIGGVVNYYFDVAKDANAGTITELYMCADYAHAHANVTGNQAASHATNSSGIHFSGNVISYFDEIPYADSQAAVNW